MKLHIKKVEGKFTANFQDDESNTLASIEFRDKGDLDILASPARATLLKKGIDQDTLDAAFSSIYQLTCKVDSTSIEENPTKTALGMLVCTTQSGIIVILHSVNKNKITHVGPIKHLSDIDDMLECVYDEIVNKQFCGTLPTKESIGSLLMNIGSKVQFELSSMPDDLSGFKTVEEEVSDAKLVYTVANNETCVECKNDLTPQQPTQNEWKLIQKNIFDAVFDNKGLEEQYPHKLQVLCNNNFTYTANHQDYFDPCIESQRVFVDALIKLQLAMNELASRGYGKAKLTYNSSCGPEFTFRISGRFGECYEHKKVIIGESSNIEHTGGYKFDLLEWDLSECVLRVILNRLHSAMNDLYSLGFTKAKIKETSSFEQPFKIKLQK